MFSRTVAAVDAGLSLRRDKGGLQLETPLGDDVATVQSEEEPVRVALGSARVRSGGHAPPSVRVVALLGRMRQLAVRGATKEVSGSEREAMGQEFARLSGQIDQISEDLSRVVPRGEIPANYDSVEAFFESIFADETLDGLLDPFSAYSLGVDVGSVHLKTPYASERAIDIIDDAVEEMERIHRDGASTEAHLDAALERLAAFVESIDPEAVVPSSPDAALEAAETVRLQLMSDRGLVPLGQSKNLQQSVTALLQ